MLVGQIRRALVVVEEQATRSVGMAVARTILAEAIQGDLADEVEQARRLGRCPGGWRLTGHGPLRGASVLRITVCPRGSRVR
jgi:hypothetical protein